MRRLLAFPLLLWLTVALTPLGASAHEFHFKDLVLHHPWARATLGGVKTGVIYLTIRNSSKQAEALVGASTPIAEKTELHQTTMNGDVMEMKRLESLELPGESEVKLAPNGVHLMMFGVKTELRKWDTFPLTLTFRQSGSVDVDVLVEDIVGQ